MEYVNLNTLKAAQDPVLCFYAEQGGVTGHEKVLNEFRSRLLI